MTNPTTNTATLASLRTPPVRTLSLERQASLKKIAQARAHALKHDQKNSLNQSRSPEHPDVGRSVPTPELVPPKSSNTDR